MIVDYLNLSFTNLRHRKLRSWLTIIGIIIGIGAVITLLLVSQGLENAIVEQFNQIGANRIYVLPKTQIGGSFESALTQKDQEIIDSVPGVEWTLGYKATGAEISFGREKEFSPYVISMQTKDLESKFKDVFFYTPSKGRIFDTGETKSAYIGSNIAYEIFSKDAGVGNTIKVNNVNFKVIGIAPKLGTPDDNNVFIPEDDFIELFPSFESEMSFIEIKAYEGINVNEAANKIEKELEKRRDDENFRVDTPESFLETLKTILGVIQVVLGGIAAISLVVGGVGIANSMFTSVLERTREIGIMKAVGAKNIDILSLFIIESGILGLIGGIFGVIFGVFSSLIIQKIAADAGFGLLKVIISPSIIIYGLLFAVIVGIISGAVPAYRASKQKPIDSLR